MTDATETLTIDAFISARLDEDEQLARAAAQADGQDWFPVDAEYGDSPDRVEGTGDGAVGYDMYETVPPHIARHDPARVLREVAWKRHLLGFALAAFSQESKIGERPGRDPETNAYDKGRADTARFMLRLLAMSWSSHPDFRAEWTA